jgi:type I restriction enzyme S subunit
VPDGWAVERLKHVIRTVASGVSVNASNVAAEDDQFGVLKTSAVSDGKFFPEENKAVWESEVDRLACPVTRDTVIMSRMNTPSLVGESGYVPADFPGLFLPDRLWKLQFDSSKVQTVYISKVLSSSGAREALSIMATGTSPSMKNLSIEEMGDLPVPLPPLDEQAVISSFLESETARIDGLIAGKERMLELLEEKRAALISRVVTRGLDQNAPLKPSGQEWLGEIPAHWEIRTLKRASSRIDTGSTPAASFMDGSLPSDFTWFTPSDFEHGGVIAESNRKIPQEAVDEGEAKVFPAQSLMVIGIGATLGKVASSRARFSANQQINVITPLESVRWDYLLYVLQGYEHVFRAHANSATLPILNQERLGVIRVPVPPSAEQDAIVTRLNESRAEYAEVNQLLGNSISLLKERRAALITAAVTGQIPLQEMTG